MCFNYVNFLTFFDLIEFFFADFQTNKIAFNEGCF